MIEMSIVNYYSNVGNYKLIYKKKYNVKVRKPAVGEAIHNIFTGSIDKTSTYKPFVLTGPLGDELVLSTQELVENFETLDGSNLAYALQELGENKSLSLSYKATDKKYYVAMVPYRLSNFKMGKLICNRSMMPLYGVEKICKDYQMAVQNASKRDTFLQTYAGNITHVSKITNNNLLVQLPERTQYVYEIPHSTGDFIVCEATPSGDEADLNTAVCINGSLFEQCFDMRYVSSISINLFSVLLEVELKKKSVQGYKLLNKDGGQPGVGSMSYQFVSDNNYANEHTLVFAVNTNNKTGKFALTLNKDSKDIVTVVECLGQRVSLISYNDYKNKYIEYCKTKKVKQANDLELIGNYVEKVVTDCCNYVYMAEFKISKETEMLSQALMSEVKKMFVTLGQGMLKDDKLDNKQGYNIYTLVYQHKLYGFESKSCVRFRLDTCVADAYIYDNNTHKAVLLVKQTRLQNSVTIKEFVNAFKSNLIQIVSGSALN